MKGFIQRPMPPATSQVFNLSVWRVAIDFWIRVFWVVWVRDALTLAFNIIDMLRTLFMVPSSLSAILVLVDICPVKNRCKRVGTFAPLAYNLVVYDICLVHYIAATHVDFTSDSFSGLLNLNPIWPYPKNLVLYESLRSAKTQFYNRVSFWIWVRG